jgi:hypothetical protein
MSIANYSELQTAVINRLHRAGLTALVPDFIALGEARIYRDLRIRCMETALSGAISAGVLALPAGYIELKSAYIDGSPTRKLTRKSLDYIYTNYPTRSSSSCPVFMAREGDNFVFGPYPDTGYTVKGIYYKRLSALSDSNTTNWFTANAPDILLYAALVEAADHVSNDAALVKWDAKYLQVKDRIQHENDVEELSGSTLSMSAE